MITAKYITDTPARSSRKPSLDARRAMYEADDIRASYDKRKELDFADFAKSDKPSLNDKMFREYLERQHEVINTEVERRIKEIAASMTSESIVEVLEASLKSCIELTEQLAEKDKVIKALWNMKDQNWISYYTDGFVVNKGLANLFQQIQSSDTIDDFVKNFSESKDDNS